MLYRMVSIVCVLREPISLQGRYRSFSKTELWASTLYYYLWFAHIWPRIYSIVYLLISSNCFYFWFIEIQQCSFTNGYCTRILYRGLKCKIKLYKYLNGWKVKNGWKYLAEYIYECIYEYIYVCILSPSASCIQSCERISSGLKEKPIRYFSLNSL